MFPVTEELFSFDEVEVMLCLPEPAAVQKAWQEGTIQFPYWSRNWEAATALARFIVANRSMIKNKTAIELAAGLGLPSLVAAHFASRVLCTDRDPAALHFCSRSAALNQLPQVLCQTLDWNQAVHIEEELILLSDVNYAPADFDNLFVLVTGWLKAGKMILLSTPQRLLSKPFIERLMPYVIQQTTEEIAGSGGIIPVSIFVLKAD